ncbi:hypothetical protein [Streptomyces sp. Wb2n-11]|uniref:hypothetical protein n=1 Tax=Streptomyces sp. Wb2n-11 TaxID=1030533 RepID=UPI000AE25661|nr:hypothetical protein [Streptomyces sp. Wb2n-11]
MPRRPGTVTHLHDRRPPRSLNSGGPPGGQPAPGARTPVPDSRLTELVQALFLHRDLSLADRDTAAAFFASLEAVEVLVDGAAAVGQIEEEQQLVMRGHIQALRDVPVQFGT